MARARRRPRKRDGNPPPTRFGEQTHLVTISTTSVSTFLFNQEEAGGEAEGDAEEGTDEEKNEDDETDVATCVWTVFGCPSHGKTGYSCKKAALGFRHDGDTVGWGHLPDNPPGPRAARDLVFADLPRW